MDTRFASLSVRSARAMINYPITRNSKITRASDCLFRKVITFFAPERERVLRNARSGTSSREDSRTFRENNK